MAGYRWLENLTHSSICRLVVSPVMFIQQRFAYLVRPTYFPTLLTGKTYFFICSFMANFINNNFFLKTQYT